MNPPLPRICLINMPFASLEAPSIALTQLKAVVDEQFAGRIRVEVLYLNLEFLEFTGGLDPYRGMISGHARLAGAADWFFRQAAFPEAPDNTDAYLGRFYFDRDDRETGATRDFLLEQRSKLHQFLDHLVERHRLDQAAVVGFTSLFYQTMASFAMARRIKHHNPGVTTVIGGAACEAEMGLEIARRVDPIDYVFSGPALVSFPVFLDCHLAGDREGCGRIDGVFCRSNLASCRRRPCHDEEPPSPASVHPIGMDLNIDRNLPLDYRDFLDRFDEALPPGSLVVDTGGCKGYAEHLERATILARYRTLLGVEASEVINEYGMTETRAA